MKTRLAAIAVLVWAAIPAAAPAATNTPLSAELIAPLRSAFGRAIAADPLRAGAFARATALPYIQAGPSVAATILAQARKDGVAASALPPASSSSVAQIKGHLAHLEPALRTRLTRAAGLIVGAVEQTAKLRVSAFRNLTASDVKELVAGAPAAEPIFNPDNGGHATLVRGATARDLEPFARRLNLIRKIDRGALLTAAATIGAAIDAARVELRGGLSASAGTPALATIPTPYGDIVVKGTGADVNDEQALLLIDLGGSDTYLGTTASATGELDDIVGGQIPGPNDIVPLTQTRIVLDVDGADTYGSTLTSKTQGFGFGGGFGILVDDGSGPDVYRADDNAQGHGVLGGLGLLVDAGGANTFSADRFTQGSGNGGGLGILSAGNGSDRYTAFVYSQGTGYDGGSGTIVDSAGNDTYRCTGTIDSADSILPVTGSRPTTACHGTGYGGQGFLVDAAGDDTYFVATSFSAMALIGAGGQVDAGGNDTHDAGEWSNGIAALGEAVVASGTGNTSFKSFARAGLPWLDIFVGSNGEGYSGGVGVMDDAGGNDTYEATVLKGSFLEQFACSAGCGFGDGIGIMNETGGNDTYRVEVGQGAAMASYALLLDAAGSDTYLRNTNDHRTQGFGGPDDHPTAGGLGAMSCGIAYIIDAGGADVYTNPVVTAGVRANDERWNNGDFGRGMDGLGAIAEYLVEQAEIDLENYIARTACTIVKEVIDQL